MWHVPAKLRKVLLGIRFLATISLCCYSAHLQIRDDQGAPNHCVYIKFLIHPVEQPISACIVCVVCECDGHVHTFESRQRHVDLRRGLHDVCTANRQHPP